MRSRITVGLIAVVTWALLPSAAAGHHTTKHKPAEPKVAVTGSTPDPAKPFEHVFTPAEVDVPNGWTVQFSNAEEGLAGSGLFAAPHTWTLEGERCMPGVAECEIDTGEVEAGHSKDVTVENLRPGTYVVRCIIGEGNEFGPVDVFPAHSRYDSATGGCSGMCGTVTVTNGPPPPDQGG